MTFKQYKTFSTEDFVLDEDFRKMVEGKLAPHDTPELLKEKFPKKIEQIDLAITIVKALQTEEHEQPVIQKINLWEKIISKQSRQVFLPIFKYAAVAILFFSIGSSLVYLYMEGNQQNVLVDNILMPSNMQEPILIFDGNQKIQLNEGKSEIDYSKKGEITINKNNVIQDEVEEPTMNTLVIPYGSRSTITLADGSKVWLNAGSKLIYPSRFVDKKRVL